jgi:hypothetical protein
MHFLPRLVCPAVLGTVILLMSNRAGTQPVAASSSLKLLNLAVRDVNTVNSLVYTKTVVEVSKHAHITIFIRGQEDDIHNREQDHETFSANGTQKDGKKATVRYVLDVIFIDNQTYFRRSTDKGKWSKQAGTNYTDSYLGPAFRRGRTQVSYAANLRFKEIGGQVPPGQSHFQAAINLANEQGTMDVFVSRGTKPYVVSDEVKVSFVQSGERVTEDIRSQYKDFNQTLIIQAPNGSST